MLRHLPNFLSAARIAAVPVLVALAAYGLKSEFTWVLVPALLTDVADGLVARLFHLQSKLGALLDSTADTLLMLAACYGVWRLHPEVPQQHGLEVAVALGAWLIEDVAALARYRRLSSFHTYLSKIAGNLLGLFIGVLFVFGLEPWLLRVAVVVSVLASLEELVLLVLLPKWQANVRGIPWVLLERAGRR
jgi:CDP-diacylglycerol--glycerol-3-phosphate 3-phosphatidyltransferase